VAVCPDPGMAGSLPPRADGTAPGQLQQLRCALQPGGGFVLEAKANTICFGEFVQAAQSLAAQRGLCHSGAAGQCAVYVSPMSSTLQPHLDRGADSPRVLWADLAADDSDDGSTSVDWAVNGMEADVAGGGCGGSSTQPAPPPAPKSRCADMPGDCKNSSGSTCAGYAQNACCTAHGSHCSGWGDSITFDEPVPQAVEESDCARRNCDLLAEVQAAKTSAKALGEVVEDSEGAVVAGASAGVGAAKAEGSGSTAPAPSPTPTQRCEVAANVACCGCGGGSTAPAPASAPTQRCTDTPGDRKGSSGSTCADYVSKACCIADGARDNGRDDNNTFDDRAVNGVVALIKNLDTGEVCFVEEDDLCTSSLGIPEGPAAALSRSSRPWDGWWQELRQSNKELWKAAETGNTKGLWAALGSDAASAAVDATACSSPGAGPARTFADSVANDESSRLPFYACVSNPRAPAFVDSRTLDGHTALHIAASNGQVECIETLLRTRADIDACTDSGFSALHLACQRGHLNVVQRLHAERCDMSAQTHEQEHALHLASARGNITVLAFLLEVCGSELLCLRNSYGQRPAEVCRDIDTLALFSGMDRSGFGSVHSLCGSGRSEHGEGEDTYTGRTPFHQGSVVLRNSRVDVVSQLLRRTGVEKTGKLRTGPDADSGASYESVRKVVRKSSSTGSPSFAPDGRRHKMFSKLRLEGSELAGPDSFSLRAMLGKNVMKMREKSNMMGQNLLRYAMTGRNLLS